MKTLHAFNAVVLFAMSQVLSFAQEGVGAAGGGGVVKETLKAANAGGAGPSTAVSASRSMKAPVLNIDEMTEDEVRAALRTLQSQRGSDRTSTKTIRFNDGSEANLYAAGEKMLDGRVAKGGEVKSARASGTISVYGFGRNPLSLYPNQLIDFLSFGPDIITFIRDNREKIDEYLASRSEFRQDRDPINTQQLDVVLGWYNQLTCAEHEQAEVEEDSATGAVAHAV